MDRLELPPCFQTASEALVERLCQRGGGEKVEMCTAFFLEHGDLVGLGAAFALSLDEFEEIGLHGIPADRAGRDSLREVAAALHIVATVDEDRAACERGVVRFPARGSPAAGARP